MPAEQLSGERLAQNIMHAVALGIDRLACKIGLVVFSVGDNGSAQPFRKSLERVCAQTPIMYCHKRFPAGTQQAVFESVLGRCAAYLTDHCMLVQQPLPENYDVQRIQEIIPPEKDIDCFGAANRKAIAAGQEPKYLPAAAQAVIDLLTFYGIALHEKPVTLVGRGFVGMPLGYALLQKGAKLTVCGRDDPDLSDKCRNADVLITATPDKRHILPEYVKRGAAVIDLGNNVDRGAEDVAGYITPVRGGIGPVTSAIVLRNVLDAASNRRR